MPSINTHEVVDRNNRPAVQSPVMLRTFFINDGEYQDPLYVSSVHVFQRSENLTPESVLDENGLISSSMTHQAQMVFGPSGDAKVNGADAEQFSPGGYSQLLNGVPGNGIYCENVSGIYRLGKGEYACVLDGRFGPALSGIDGNGNAIGNTADLATRYIDVWTIKLGDGTTWKTYINGFALYDDAFLSITEPPMLRTKNTLFNRRVTIGSKTDLKIGTEITVENLNIDNSIKNIFKESAINRPRVEIQKINDNPSLPGRFTVVDSSNVELTADNTIIYTFDTSVLASQGDLNNAAPDRPDPIDPADEIKFRDNLGPRQGTYALRVSYNLLHEKIVSEFMYFIVQ